MSIADIHAKIDAAISNGGGTPQMAEFLKHIMSAESGGDRCAKNTRSSATGIFQFIDSTWNACGGGDKYDVATQCRNAVTLAKKNEAALVKVLGREPDAGEFYLAHFAGAAGAAAVLQANPGTRLRDIPIMRQAIGSNPHIANFTAGELRAWTSRKMGGALSLSGGGDMEEERGAREQFLRDQGMSEDAIKHMDVFSKVFVALFMSIMDKAMKAAPATNIAQNTEQLPSPQTPPVQRQASAYTRSAVPAHA